MTTKDELNRQAEKRTDKNNETLDRAEELKKELVFRWGFQRGEPVWDLFKNELDEYAEAYYKYRVNAISDEEKLKKYYKYLCEIGVISNEYSGDSDVDFYYYTFIDTYPCLNCFNQICECDE